MGAKADAYLRLCQLLRDHPDWTDAQVSEVAQQRYGLHQFTIDDVLPQARTDAGAGGGVPGPQL